MAKRKRPDARNEFRRYVASRLSNFLGEDKDREQFRFELQRAGSVAIRLFMDEACGIDPTDPV